MDWEAERKMLERILALLLSLAGLCDRAAGLPALVRLPVLAILGTGEAVTRPFVMELASASGLPAHAAARPAVAGCLTAGDAGRLAASFRALALVLGAVLAWARHPARLFARAASPSAVPTPRRQPAGWPTGRPGRNGCPAAAVPAPDTS